MSTEWLLYWFVKVDEIRGFLHFTGETSILFIFALAAGIVIPILIYNDNKLGCGTHNEEIWEIAKKRIKTFMSWWTGILIIVILSTFISMMIPSTKQIAAIYLGSQAVKSEALQEASKLPKKYAEILNKQADQYLEELSVEVLPQVKEEAIDTAKEVKEVVKDTLREELKAILNEKK